MVIVNSAGYKFSSACKFVSLLVAFRPQNKTKHDHLNQSEILPEDFSDIPVKTQKPPAEGKGQDTCSIPCDITLRLLRDEKHSLCGKVCLLFLLNY